MKVSPYCRGKKQLFRLVADPSAVGQRLDQWLSLQIAELSRSEARRIIDIGGVQVDGRRARTCSLPLQEGSRIEINTDGQALEPFRLSDDRILYRDPYLLVLDKPAGIDTQPTPARYKGTLYEALLHLLGPAKGRKKAELGMVQRLDRGTSGLMVFSTHPRAHRGLSRIFLEHRVEKRYLALVSGEPRPASGEIRSLLARSRRLNRMVSVAKGGKEAITRYRTLVAAETTALIEVELLTGRSHQIRVHMAESGAPLLGDSLYGGPLQAGGLHFERPLLHAWKLGFRHPVTQETLNFELPPPADMQEVCKMLFGAHCGETGSLLED